MNIPKIPATINRTAKIPDWEFIDEKGELQEAEVTIIYRSFTIADLRREEQEATAKVRQDTLAELYPLFHKPRTDNLLEIWQAVKTIVENDGWSLTYHSETLFKRVLKVPTILGDEAVTLEWLDAQVSSNLQKMSKAIRDNETAKK